MSIKYSILSRDNNFIAKTGDVLDLSGEFENLYQGDDTTLMLKRPLIKETNVLILHYSSYRKFNPDFIKKATTKNPNIKILLYANEDDISFLRLAYQYGVSALLTENKDQLSISYVINTVLKGGKVICPFITNEFLKVYISSDIDPNIGELSGKTKRIWMLLTEGKSYAEMGVSTGLTIDGVREQIKKLYRKLGVNSRGQATAAYINAYASISGVNNE